MSQTQSDLLEDEPATMAEYHASDFDKQFVPFFFRIHAFGDKKKVDGVEVTYGGQILDDAMVSGGEAKLIPADFIKPVNKARRRLRAHVRRHCLSGDGEGCYCVNVARSVQFFESFNKLKADLDDATALLVGKLPEIKAMLRAKWRSKIVDDCVYNKRVGSLLPANEGDFLACYSVETRLSNKDDPRAAAALTRYRNGVIREWFEAAHKGAIEHDLNQRRAQYREPIERLRKGVDVFRLQLNQGNRLTPKSFREFEDRMDLFQACVDVLAPDLVTTVQALAAELASVKAEATQAMNDKSATFTESVKLRKSSINQLIDRFVADCEVATTEAAMADRIGRMPRGIRFNATVPVSA